MKYIFLCILCFLANSYSFGNNTDVFGPDLFFGTWSTETSKTLLIIKGEGSQFEISMLDTSNFKRKIEITDIEWNGEILVFTAYVAENDWKVKHTLKANDPSSISDNINCSKLKIDQLLWKKIGTKTPH